MSGSDRPTAPPPPTFDVHERPTLVPCVVCDGNYATQRETEDGRYAMTCCAWCTSGAMSQEQLRHWSTHRAR